MAAPKRRFNVLISVREYTKADQSTGHEYLQIGKAVEWEKGNITLEINSIPLKWLSEGEGKAVLFEQKPKDGEASTSSASTGGAGDDLPF